VVLLHFSGRPVVLSYESENVPAILQVWFGGSEAGNAIADVVFGDVSPSGKLTTSFPRNEGQLPVHYNVYNTGRPLPANSDFVKFRSCYMDVKNEPLYPFGYGLSYTTFKYSDVELSSSSIAQGGRLTATVTVTNTGGYDADEIVQRYIRDMAGTVVRPVKELKGFKRVSLKKGESQTVSFDIDAGLLKFYNGNLDYVCEPGEFEVMIGPNCMDVSRKTFTLK